MKSISKVLLLSVVGLCVDNGNITYATMKISDSVPKSGIPTLHIHHTYLRHTQEIPFLSSHLFDDLGISGEEQKVASVCFITDAGNCSGDKFGNLETPSGGSGKPDDHGTPQELCQDAGYTNTPCPEGSKPSNYCPYDSSYHSKCLCASDYNKSCNSSDGLKGVGQSCDGKYKECCNLCSDYKYTSVPSGYINIGECLSCDGKKYKVRCDTQLYVSAAVCGSQGGSGATCTDDTGTYYKSCKCPANSVWDEALKKCICSTSYRYYCTGTGYAGGDGNSCDNKFAKCKCASGYVWNASQGACTCNGLDWCSLNRSCSSLGYSRQTCSGKSLKCPFDTTYIYCLKQKGEIT